MRIAPTTNQIHTFVMRGLMALALLALGCGDDDGMPMLDAGIDTGGGDAMIAAPEAPAQAAPANLLVDGACPGEWMRIDTEGLPAFCEPYPDGFGECADHEAHFPGELDCRAVGRPCGSGFPDVPEGATRAIYVQEGASGDGQLESPFGTIAEALEAASAGDAILIAAGEYAEEALPINRAVTIRGACASATRVVAPSPSEESGIFNVLTTDVVLEDMLLSGPRIGVLVEVGASAQVRGLALVNVAEASLAAFGDLIVDDVVARMSNDRLAGFFNAGVVAYDGATLTVRNSVFRGHFELNAQVRNATATFEDVLFGAHFVGLVPTGGRGLEASGGAQVAARRAVFDVNAEIGALSSDSGTSLTLEDTYFAEIVGDIGASIAAVDGASATLTRTFITDAIPAAIVAAREANVRSTDLFVGFAGGDDQEGYGLQVSDSGTRVELERAAIYAASTAGLSNSGAELSLTDVSVFDVGNGGDYEVEDFAFGIVLLDGSVTTIERVFLENNDIYGVAVSESQLRGTDLIVSTTFSHPLTAVGGALWLDESPTTLQRVLLDENQNAGFVAFGEATQATLTDLVIDSTFRSGCFDRGCTSFVGGVGMGSYGAAVVDVRSFRIVDNELIGAQVAFGADEDMVPLPVGGTLNLSNGVVEGNLVGINVQIPDYDFDRFENVTFGDNERDFDSTLMSVPAPPAL